MATAIKTDKWIKRWEVPKSSGDGNWIVAIDKDGNYGCSCPIWKFKRQECHHILEVRQNGGSQIESLTPEQRANLKLKAYAEKGYRYYIWYHDPLYSWDRRSIEVLKARLDIDDVKTFSDGYHRFVLIKENPIAYENEFNHFVEELKKLNFRRKYVHCAYGFISQKELREQLNKRWFDITQHIIYNKTGTINPNLPDGSVYTRGEWGKRITQLQKHYKFLR